MTIQIRPFENADYDAIVAVLNSAVPRNVTTVARLLDWDTNHPAHLKAARWVAEMDGAIVAIGEYAQSPDLYHPGKFQVVVTVHPRYQHRGIGSELYDFVTARLESHDPIGYQARCYGDQEDALRFIEARGFEEDFRMWISQLDVDSFDPEPWHGLEASLEARGIQIVSLAELTGDRDRDWRVFLLERETTQGIPSPQSVTSTHEQLTPEEVEERFTRYVERVLNHPERPLDAYFVARFEGEYVGLTYFELDREHRRAEILMTGVKEAYRGWGIGIALKLRGIAWARQHGYKTIVTGNDTVNWPILAINDRLGFVRQPEMIFFEKALQPEYHVGDRATGYDGT